MAQNMILTETKNLINDSINDIYVLIISIMEFYISLLEHFCSSVNSGTNRFTNLLKTTAKFQYQTFRNYTDVAYTSYMTFLTELVAIGNLRYTTTMDIITALLKNPTNIPKLFFSHIKREFEAVSTILHVVAEYAISVKKLVISWLEHELWVCRENLQIFLDGFKNVTDTWYSVVNFNVDVYSQFVSLQLENCRRWNNIVFLWFNAILSVVHSTAKKVINAGNLFAGFNKRTAENILDLVYEFSTLLFKGKLASEIISFQKKIALPVVLRILYYTEIVANGIIDTVLIVGKKLRINPPKTVLEFQNDVIEFVFPDNSQPPKEQPAILQNPTYGKRGFIQLQGGTLHYVEDGDKTKPLILFLHGFPDFWFSWREQTKYYSQYYWTVALDLRGYGSSEKPESVYSYELDTVVDDIKNLIHMLGRESCILIGHDWGGLVIYSFILRYPKMVDKYVTLNCPPPFTVKLTSAQVNKFWDFYFFQIPLLPEIYFRYSGLFEQRYKKSGQEVVDAYKYTFRSIESFIYPIHYYRANLITLINYVTNGIPNLKDLELPPGLAIGGGKDEYVDISSFDGAFNVPNLQIEIETKEGHFMHQFNSKSVNKHIDLFLNVKSSENLL